MSGLDKTCQPEPAPAPPPQFFTAMEDGQQGTDAGREQRVESSSMKQISDVGLQPEVLHCSLKDLSHVDVSPNKGVFLAMVVVRMLVYCGLSLGC